MVGSIDLIRGERFVSGVESPAIWLKLAFLFLNDNGGISTDSPAVDSFGVLLLGGEGCPDLVFGGEIGLDDPGLPRRDSFGICGNADELAFLYCVLSTRWPQWFCRSR